MTLACPQGHGSSPGKAAVHTVLYCQWPHLDPLHRVWPGVPQKPFASEHRVKAVAPPLRISLPWAHC